MALSDTILIQRIDAVLPQTQCRRCGYDGCRPYAHAIAQGSATINQCPPGGDDAVAALSKLLGVPLLSLDRARGESGPLLGARIDETACIGCTLCVAACPVDAIVGAAKLMHTVIAQNCTGCELCLPPCPVDCIVMERVSDAPTVAQNRSRYDFRNFRLARDAAEKKARAAPRTRMPGAKGAQIAAAVAAAMERARKRRADLAK